MCFGNVIIIQFCFWNRLLRPIRDHIFQEREKSHFSPMRQLVIFLRGRTMCHILKYEISLQYTLSHHKLFFLLLCMRWNGGITTTLKSDSPNNLSSFLKVFCRCLDLHLTSTLLKYFYCSIPWQQALSAGNTSSRKKRSCFMYTKD